MKKKFLSMMVCILMIFTFTTAWGVSFSDIQDNNWSWAKDSIEDMAAEGIITGYPDGTFGPDNSVTKIQSLILLARIIGVNEKENEKFVNLAFDQYKDELITYSTNYKKEVAYLLYKGVIKENEIDDYISIVNANVSLKRYEAAILLTKLMGAEEDVKSKIMVVLPFHDIDKIPDYAEGYVEYVKKQGIMGGMSETEFGPNYDVTRAQMAVMLYRVMNKLDDLESKIEGTIASYSVSNDEITIKNVVDAIKKYDINEDAKYRLDGKEVDLNDYKIGTEVVITVTDDEVVFIEGISSEDIVDKVRGEKTVEGLISSVYYSGGSKKLKIKYEDEDGKTQTETYYVDSDVDVTYDGVSKTVNSLKTGDMVTLGIEDDEVVEVVAESKTKYVEGVISEIIIEPDVKVIMEDEDGDEFEYEVDSDVYVKKNGSKTSMQNVRVGDEVELKLEYGIVKKIEAESEEDEESGIVDEIVISKTPTINVRDGEDISTYVVDRNAVIKIDDEIKDIYGLRLGCSVKLTLEGNTITRIEASAVSMSKQITGTVESINESYDFIKVIVINEENEVEIKQVFVKGRANIIESSTSDSIDLDDVEEGDIVTAIGTDESGVFEATTVIIIN